MLILFWEVLEIKGKQNSGKLAVTVFVWGALENSFWLFQTGFAKAVRDIQKSSSWQECMLDVF